MDRGRRPLVLVLAAHFVSLTGNAMTLLAVPWFVLETTGSPARTGVAAASMVLPVVVSLVFGGVLVDRIGYRRMSIIGDVASGVTVLLIPILYAVELLSFPALLALVFFSALLDAPGMTARAALLPDLAGAAGTKIARASSALDVVERSARMVGAPLAGGLIVWIGAANVLVVDAATFAVASALVVVSGAPAGASDRSRTHYLTGLREGLGLIRRDRLLRAIILVITVTNMIDLAFAGVVLPVYSDQILGGAGALGLLVGSGVLNPILTTAEYERVPAHMRARVLGTVQAGVVAASPMGPILGGLLIGYAGLTPTLLTLAVTYLAATLAPLVFQTTWRQLSPAGQAA